MRKTATEILRDLEIRVANLESGYPNLKEIRNQENAKIRQEQFLVDSEMLDMEIMRQLKRKFGFDVIEDVDSDLLYSKYLRKGRYETITLHEVTVFPEGHIERDIFYYALVVNKKVKFLTPNYREALKQMGESYSSKFDLNKLRAKPWSERSQKFARLERQADTSLTHEVRRKILVELNKYTGLKFNNSFSLIDVLKREASKRSDSDFVWVKVQEEDKFAYVIFELLPIGLAMNFMFYDLEDYKMANSDFSKYVRQGKI